MHRATVTRAVAVASTSSAANLKLPLAGAAQAAGGLRSGGSHGQPEAATPAAVDPPAGPGWPPASERGSRRVRRPAADSDAAAEGNRDRRDVAAAAGTGRAGAPATRQPET